MNDPTMNYRLVPTPPAKARGIEQVYEDILKKSLKPTNFLKATKLDQIPLPCSDVIHGFVKNRSNCVDAVHRFGKKSGST